MVFTDEDGHASPVHLAHHLHLAVPLPQARASRSWKNKRVPDKGKTRKALKPEDILEAIQTVLPKTHGRVPKRVAPLPSLRIEQGLLQRSQVARTTLYRLVREFELLKPDQDSANKHRLAFAKAHANENVASRHALRAVCEDQWSRRYRPGSIVLSLMMRSRVCCFYGQFFPAENATLLH